MKFDMAMPVKNTTVKYNLLFSLALGLLLPSLGFAAKPKPPLYGQVLFGKLRLDDNTVKFTANEDEFEGELPSSLPYFGAAAQAYWKDNVFGYGWEGGGFFSWQNESVSYRGTSGGGGTSITITIDNNFWSFETFMGLYGSFKPHPKIRFYVSGGPLFLFAVAKAENLEQEPVPDPFVDNGIVIDLDQYHTDFTIGGYARTGFDIHLQDNFWIGFSARYMKADINLSKTLGKFDIDGNLYFFSLTQKY